ncbi:MAG: helix-turn-helix domain-containing protein [Synergistaceae bacterium]|jgi:transposase|nr:helix-turn-helix domain-containing protein [Synergistaceae bacterium]
MIIAYKTEIDPVPEQIEKIHRTTGVCRFVYNLFIATK